MAKAKQTKKVQQQEQLDLPGITPDYSQDNVPNPVEPSKIAPSRWVAEEEALQIRLEGIGAILELMQIKANSLIEERGYIVSRLKELDSLKDTA